jgi:phosphatidylserine decarboxylase
VPLLRLIAIYCVAPIYGRLVNWLAYGPWGPLHQMFIAIFKKMYGIEWSGTQKFRTLGEFFLRPVRIELSNRPLSSPVEGFCFEGPTPVLLTETISAKGICYGWKSFYEIETTRFPRGTYWNFYLAPQNYHWVHSPAAGSKLEGFRTQGAKLPVNAFGRWLEPKLFHVNERLTFRFATEEFGQVYLICVGAMGVASLYCDKGVVEYDRWTTLEAKVEKGEKLLGFRLGSTVIMVTEKPVSSPLVKSVVRVGDALA